MSRRGCHQNGNTFSSIYAGVGLRPAFGWLAISLLSAYSSADTLPVVCLIYLGAFAWSIEKVMETVASTGSGKLLLADCLPISLCLLGCGFIFVRLNS